MSMLHYTSRGTDYDFTTLLEGATNDELKELIDNEDKVNELICDHDEIKKIKLDKELLQAENRSIADHNISKEPKLNELRQTLAAKYEHLKELNDKFLLNQAKMDSLQKDVNLETMLAVLQTTCAQTEEESENLAEKFFTGDLPLSDFISEFKAKRTLAHLRRIKSEKMRELILQAERNPSVSSPAPSIPPRIPTTTARSTTAYPGSNQSVPAYPGSNQSVPAYPGSQFNAQPRYPANAFSQPAAQQYPGFQWK